MTESFEQMLVEELKHFNFNTTFVDQLPLMQKICLLKKASSIFYLIQYI